MIKMEIKGLLMDPVSNMPVVILRDTENGLFLPIWVGIFEANAIALEMEKVATPRPMTHDLLKNLLAELGTRVDRDRHQRSAGQHVLRPDPPDARRRHAGSSTAGRATRSRWRCARTPRSSSRRRSSRRAADLRAEGDQDPDRLQKWLEEVNPDDLGKYRM